jgi:hypothetical protein
MREVLRSNLSTEKREKVASVLEDLTGFVPKGLLPGLSASLGFSLSSTLNCCLKFLLKTDASLTHFSSETSSVKTKEKHTAIVWLLNFPKANVLKDWSPCWCYWKL